MPLLIDLIHSCTGTFAPAALLLVVGLAAAVAGFGAGLPGRIGDREAG